LMNNEVGSRDKSRIHHRGLIGEAP
jgi:hypothetical protein